MDSGLSATAAKDILRRPPTLDVDDAEGCGLFCTLETQYASGGSVRYRVADPEDEAVKCFEYRSGSDEPDLHLNYTPYFLQSIWFVVEKTGDRRAVFVHRGHKAGDAVLLHIPLAPSNAGHVAMHRFLAGFLQSTELPAGMTHVDVALADDWSPGLGVDAASEGGYFMYRTAPSSQTHVVFEKAVPVVAAHQRIIDRIALPVDDDPRTPEPLYYVAASPADEAGADAGAN